MREHRAKKHVHERCVYQNCFVLQNSTFFVSNNKDKGFCYHHGISMRGTDIITWES